MPPPATTATVTVSPGAPGPECRTLLPKISLTSRTASSPHGCPAPSTSLTNARAARARSARPASVTLSRTAALAITAPALPRPPRPGKPAGQRADAGTCTLSSATNVKPAQRASQTFVRGPSVVAAPSVAVRAKPTVPPHRSRAPIFVRYASVDGATQRSTALQGDTRRDRAETARIAENSQLAGHNRRWWQVLGSNQRRLSRRFYRPPSSCLSHMPLTCAYAFRDAVPGRRVRYASAPRVRGSRSPRTQALTTTDGEGGNGYAGLRHRALPGVEGAEAPAPVRATTEVKGHLGGGDKVVTLRDKRAGPSQGGARGHVAARAASVVVVALVSVRATRWRRRRRSGQGSPASGSPCGP
jgi:hypothetical protein